jgi:hypothetical protein
MSRTPQSDQVRATDMHSPHPLEVRPTQLGIVIFQGVIIYKNQHSTSNPALCTYLSHSSKVTGSPLTAIHYHNHGTLSLAHHRLLLRPR